MQVYVFTILFKKLKNIAQSLQKEKKKERERNGHRQQCDGGQEGRMGGDERGHRGIHGDGKR